MKKAGFFSAVRKELEPLRRKLLVHPVYTEVNSVERLRRFMEVHVYAVWDFMSLAKRLQRDLTCVELPWVPPRSPEAARFVNEVILAEESDLGPDGKPRSHLELYLEAMEEVEAKSGRFRDFLKVLREGAKPGVALDSVSVPGFLATFVTETLRCAQKATTTEVAATFLFGREDVIPEMFERFLKEWEGGEQAVPRFAYYLRRHIELDAETHGPLAERLLVEVAGEDEKEWRLAAQSARDAMEQRIDLWDGVLDLMD